MSSESKVSKSTRARKGKVHLDRIAIERAKGIITNVEFNEYDQPIGYAGARMQSYIGVLTRQHVKVSFEDWRDVPKETKDLIWDSVTKLKLSGDEDVDRAFLWKQARKNKKGEFEGEKLLETITKIDQLTRQKQEGVLCSTQPQQDILTQALETPEHSGRVRALGAHVTPSTYFSNTKTVGRDVHGILMMEMDKKMAQMDAKIMELQAYIGCQMKRDIDEKGSCSIKNKDVYYVEDEDDVGKPQGSSPEYIKLKATYVPKTLRLLHTYGKHALKNGESILLNFNEDVLGKEIKVHLFLEDIYNMCELEPISGGCICAYILNLHKEYETVGLLGRFIFVNPYEVSHDPKVKLVKKAEILSNRLMVASINQLVLVSCNVGYHWILTVIDPYKGKIYFLDPLYHESHYEHWKQVVDMAITLFNVSKDFRGRNNCIWEVMKGPQQPDSKQCGLYVMRYMKDVIENCRALDSKPSSRMFPEGYYFKNEIDEVRIEWADFVQEYVD